MKNIIISVLLSLVLTATVTGVILYSFDFGNNQSQENSQTPVLMVPKPNMNLVVTETTMEPLQIVEIAETSEPSDPYQNWKTISPGKIVELKIPENCFTEGAAGSTYITCLDTAEGTSLSDMIISTDGESLKIKHGENIDWSNWEQVISTIRILPNLNRKVTITIEN